MKYEKRLLADFLAYDKQVMIDAAINQIKASYQNEGIDVHLVTSETVNIFKDKYPDSEAGYVRIVARVGDEDENLGCDADEWILICHQTDFAMYMASESVDSFACNIHDFIDTYVLGNERAIDDLLLDLRLKPDIYDSFVKHRKEYESECYPESDDKHMSIEASNLKKWLDGLPILDSWYKLDEVEEAFIDYYLETFVSTDDSWTGLMKPCDSSFGLGRYRYTPQAAYSLSEIDHGSRGSDKGEEVIDTLFEIFELKNVFDYVQKTLFVYWIEEVSESYIYNGSEPSTRFDLWSCVYAGGDVQVLTNKEITPYDKDPLNGYAIMLFKLDNF